MNVVNIGGFFAGDRASTIQVTVRKRSDGTPYDFTGATQIALVCSRFGVPSTAVVISGAVSGSPSAGVLLFAAVADAVPDPPAKEQAAWRAVPRWLAQGDSAPNFSYAKTEYRFTVELYP